LPVLFSSSTQGTEATGLANENRAILMNRLEP